MIFIGTLFFIQAKSGRCAHFGLAADPQHTKFWQKKSIYDESEASGLSNRRGVISFVGWAGKHKRTTKMIINFSNNADLDSQGYTPFAYIVYGMVHVDGIVKDARADEARVVAEGEEYLAGAFPRLTGITSAKIISSIHEVLVNFLCRIIFRTHAGICISAPDPRSLPHRKQVTGKRHEDNVKIRFGPYRHTSKQEL